MKSISIRLHHLCGCWRTPWYRHSYHQYRRTKAALGEELMATEDTTGGVHLQYRSLPFWPLQNREVHHHEYGIYLHTLSIHNVTPR